MTTFDLIGYRKELIRQGKEKEAEKVLQEILDRPEEEGTLYA
ncbi:MAG: hypothetical protein R3321_03045 [Nitrososphaeraceae archaeon]|nr:hypothetical protein [Nitrososphaeraceae archaeon]